MKRLFMIAVALLTLGSVANAQQSMSDESLEFRPHWSLGVQGGAGYTIGEAAFAKLLSPAAQLSATYHFHHAFGVRAGLSGWQGKGGLVVSEDIYRFQYGQLSADFTVDLASLIAGFDHQRVFSPYLFAGIGGAYGFNNEEATALAGKYSVAFPYIWDKKAFVVGRLGAGVDFWLTKAIALGIEGNANMFSDKLNSKEAGKGLLADWQFDLLAGVKFRLGDNTRPSAVYAAQVAAAEAAAAAAAALAAEKAAAEKAAAEKAAVAAENSEDVFFTIDSYYIRANEGKKLEKLAAWMKENPDFTVTLVGYADKKTGTYEINQRISERRANAVKERLVKLGVPADRIMTFFKGDTVQPFAENAKNRVVICELE